MSVDTHTEVYQSGAHSEIGQHSSETGQSFVAPASDQPMHWDEARNAWYDPGTNSVWDAEQLKWFGMDGNPLLVQPVVEQPAPQQPRPQQPRPQQPAPQQPLP
eukprot:15477637-Alexandrium_andersonii.AAC.1